MRHRKRTVKLGRTGAHRKALLSSLVCGLIQEKRIVTTLPKARAARSLAEKMVTLGKRGTLAARRQAISVLRRSDRVAVLFDEIAPLFTDRAGGYTRIVKLSPRGGDFSDMAILEWVESQSADSQHAVTDSSNESKTDVKGDKPKKGLFKGSSKTNEE